MLKTALHIYRRQDVASMLAIRITVNPCINCVFCTFSNNARANFYACESLIGSSDERISASWPPTLKKSQLT